jgi:hypothetical protein
MAVAILIGLVFLAAGALLLSKGLLLGVITGYFLAPLLFHLQRSFSSKPALEVTSEGIVDNTPNLGVGLIPWADVEDIRMGRMGVTNYLDITVRDPKVFLRRIGLAKRLNAKATAAFGHSPVFLNLATTKGSAADIWAAIKRERAGL